MQNKSSSKTITIIIIVVLVVAFGWWYFSRPQTSSAPVSVAGVLAPLSTATTHIAVDISNPSDTSNAALESDLSNIDNQMNGLQSDVNNANTPTQ